MKGWLLMLLFALASPVDAHPLSFGTLRLEESPAGTVAMSFRYSGDKKGAAPPQLIMGRPCRDVVRPVRDLRPWDETRRRLLRCDGGLAGMPLELRGLPDGTQVVVLGAGPATGPFERTLSRAASRIVLPGGPQPVPPEPAFSEFFRFGWQHIMTGWDHLLFLIVLLLLVRGPWRLAAVVTGFTLGHATTISLVLSGVEGLPAGVTEFLIALSILFLALEYGRPQTSLFYRYPALVSASFGLLHGLGFAGSLADAGMVTPGALSVLLAFNLGIEAGQLVFVGALSLALWGVRRLAGDASWRAVGRVLQYSAGGTAAFLCLSRLPDVVRGL